jgi:hypothetical protein
MPLTGNPSKDIPELKRAGFTAPGQAVAIALKEQRKHTPKGQGPGTRHKRQPRPPKK